MVGQGHEAIPHTADVGLRAFAADLDGLFAEAALGLSELALGPSVDASPEGDRDRTRIRASVELEADDLVGLAYAWLNELIGLGEIHRAAVVSVEDVRVAGPAPARLTGQVGLHAFRPGGRRPLRHLKAATYHGLTVGRTRSGWTLVAYLDV
jgi:SHS2 domain-containing protein